MKSKKGIIAFDTIMLGIVRMVEYVIALSILYALVSMVLVTKVDTSKTEGQVYINRIIYSSAYQDPETGRHYPGEIDSKKITELEARVKSSSKTAVEIKHGGKREVYNERYFNYLIPLAESKIPGKSATVTIRQMQLQTDGNPEKFEFVAVSAK